MTFDAGALKPSRRARRPRKSGAEFSTSGTYRRRGPKNRFMTQCDRASEIDRIIAMMTAGMKTADIAEAMKMSVATVYRRIDSIPKAVPPLAPQTAAAGTKRLSALLAHMHANTERAHVLAAERRQRRMAAGYTLDQTDMALEIEAMRLAADLQRAELDYLRQIGLFDMIRAEGTAIAVVRQAQHFRKNGEGTPATKAS